MNIKTHVLLLSLISTLTLMMLMLFSFGHFSHGNQVDRMQSLDSSVCVVSTFGRTVTRNGSPYIT